MPMPVMQTVDSSNIASIAYIDGERSLIVMFKTGKYYKYFNVNRSVYESMLTAESVGKFFSANVRTKYKYEELKPEPNPHISAEG